MGNGRPPARRCMDLEVMEDRIAPSGSGSRFLAASVSKPVSHHAATVFTATLTPEGVLVPESAPPNPKPIAAQPNSSDPARGLITFTLSSNGKALWVVGQLSHISNVSAVTLHDLKYPGATSNYPGIIGDTVAVLLAPGNGSGPRATASFRTVIKAPYLQGPLVGQPLSALVKDMDADQVYVNVQTNNGVDTSAAPSGPGNFPFGEIRGPVV